jgi:glutamine synthetase
MTDTQRKSLGIGTFPSSLDEALTALKSDSRYLDICFHNELIDTYIKLKNDEILEIGNDTSKLKQFVFYNDV